MVGRLRYANNLVEGGGGLVSSHGLLVGLGSRLRVLLVHGKIKGLELCEELFVGLNSLLLGGTALLVGKSSKVETKRTDETAKDIASLSPVFLVSESTSFLELGGCASHARLSVGKTGTSLGHAVTGILVEGEITGLVDDVESVLLGDAVIDEFNVASSRGTLGSKTTSNHGESSHSRAAPLRLSVGSDTAASGHGHSRAAGNGSERGVAAAEKHGAGNDASDNSDGSDQRGGTLGDSVPRFVNGVVHSDFLGRSELGSNRTVLLR